MYSLVRKRTHTLKAVDKVPVIVKEMRAFKEKAHALHWKNRRDGAGEQCSDRAA